MNRPTFRNFKEEAMADPKFKKGYEAMAPIWELRKKLIKLRMKEGKTQEQIAKLMGTQKSNISRLESGEFHSQLFQLFRNMQTHLDTRSIWRLNLCPNYCIFGHSYSTYLLP